jgi:aspartyl-tRNA(Asn)/glutamyl-tRNA(Gln) amidotransferase subunit A
VTAAQTSYVADPGQVRELAAAISGRTLSPVALARRYLDRIATTDPHVQCWREVDGERALAVAAERETEAAQGRIRGALHGVPVAIKDIIDVEGLPTHANSKSRASIAPAANDAEIVLALKARGAVILGKVHTTEFAYFDPSPARNPHNLAHTPGGSSSGSGAAVSAGMVPAALGTQTVASVNRPASYCGISAFKPSTRSTCIYGIAPLAPSYDTVGFYGYTVDDAVTLYEAAAAPFATRQPKAAENKLRVVLPEDPHLDAATDEVKTAWRGAADQLAAAGHAVSARPAPVSFEEIFTLQRSTMLYEAARCYRYALDLPPGQIGAKFLAAVRDGLAITTERYLAERARLDGLRAAFLAAHEDNDVFLWPAAPDTAPEGLGWTGDPRFISPWTLIGGPIVTIPTGRARNGLPLGCILSGAPGTDMRMCSNARAAAGAMEWKR